MKLDCGSGGRLKPSAFRSERDEVLSSAASFFFSTSLSKAISEGARQQPRHLAM